MSSDEDEDVVADEDDDDDDEDGVGIVSALSFSESSPLSLESAEFSVLAVALFDTKLGTWSLVLALLFTRAL